MTLGRPGLAWAPDGCSAVFTGVLTSPVRTNRGTSGLAACQRSAARLGQEMDGPQEWPDAELIAGRARCRPWTWPLARAGSLTSPTEHCPRQRTAGLTSSRHPGRAMTLANIDIVWGGMQQRAEQQCSPPLAATGLRVLQWPGCAIPTCLRTADWFRPGARCTCANASFFALRQRSGRRFGVPTCASSPARHRRRHCAAPGPRSPAAIPSIARQTKPERTIHSLTGHSAAGSFTATPTDRQ